MKRAIAIITVIIGLIVVILGVGISPEYASTHYAGYHDVLSASFGGDFYTYVYDGIDTIVDELSEINEGVEAMVYAERANAETIASVGKIAVIAIGLLIVVIGMNQFAASLPEKKPVVANPPYMQTSPAPYAPVYEAEAPVFCAEPEAAVTEQPCDIAASADEM